VRTITQVQRDYIGDRFIHLQYDHGPLQKCILPYKYYIKMSCLLRHIYCIGRKTGKMDSQMFRFLIIHLVGKPNSLTYDIAAAQIKSPLHLPFKIS